EKTDTLPKVLKVNREKYAARVAMREKKRGIWKKLSWNEYYEKVKCLCLGLVNLGLLRGDKVSLLSETKPEVFWAELAVQSAGGTAVGIFSDCSPSEVKYYVEHSDSKFIFAEDQEQVDKVLQIKDDVPLLKKVIYWDPKGLWFYDDTILMSLDELLKLGRECEERNQGAFENLIDNGNGNEIAVIIYTSGTTGLPKGAMLSHKGMVSSGSALTEVADLQAGEEWLAFMPMAWIGGQGMDFSAPLISAATVNFPEKPETVQENIRELGARGLMYGPRQWEATNRMIQAKMAEAGFFNRWVYNLLLPIGLHKADSLLNRRKKNPLYIPLYFLADLLVFRSLRDRIGLRRTKVAFSGGTAISPDIIRFFHAIGVNIKQLYGSSEMGLLSSHRDVIKPESCGTPLAGVEIKLSDEGEIMVKSDWRLVDYYKNPDVLKNTMKDGWYCTGDFGHIDDDGHLIVMDRMEDLRTLADGSKFSPQYTEIRLRFSPYIKEVIVVGGEDKHFVSAIVNIDLENAGHWAESKHLSYTTFADLSQKPEVIGLVKGEIAKVNAIIPEHARIGKFVNLHKELDPDEAELTRSRKLRRSFLEDRYSDIISALYGGEEDLIVETLVTYQDGREGIMKRPIKIVSV
ncbi:MAG: AMP-binding protein, partial [Thermodesulfobacteriota bacterium]|nr:AMP-binding protein [Thermodesulfobacteriota bacterium]